MQARIGDWLVVERAYRDKPRREGQVVDVPRPDGSPPYLVRWADTGQQALIFPGNDAHVEPPEGHFVS